MKIVVRVLPIEIVLKSDRCKCFSTWKFHEYKSVIFFLEVVFTNRSAGRFFGLKVYLVLVEKTETGTMGERGMELTREKIIERKQSWVLLMVHIFFFFNFQI